ncbi:hypothetical protein O181_116352 [Austropuccinia psidii MF-1]|uniref:Mitochondrial protein n=1 Tax=Austropuccinia psidii MF-1 TaxID=1389203 RepID=A0A9Q3PYA8_9BASI|nr:hypothetical protein [Austropuccinia psidii MF-1]
MKISLKKCHFGFKELKGLGKLVSGLSLGIDKTKVAEVLLKPMPPNKKEIRSFLGFAGYYRQHIKDFPSIARALYKAPGQILRQLSAIDFMSHHCLRQDNINLHMCHIIILLKAQTHFNTICNVGVITPHGATQQFGMLRLPPHCLVISTLYHADSHVLIGFRISPNPLPYLPCLCARTPLQMRLRHFPPISALTTPYASTPPPLTIFMLLQRPQDETTMPPSPLLTLLHPRLIFSLAYNPYTPAGP